MGTLVSQRQEFVNALNLLFGAGRIAETASRLGPNVRSMDALEIVFRLGLLTWIESGQFFRYRDRIGIPVLNQQILTKAFHAALLAREPKGLSMQIVEGATEAVAVSEPGGVVTILLTRTGLDPLDDPR